MIYGHCSIPELLDIAAGTVATEELHTHLETCTACRTMLTLYSGDIPSTPIANQKPEADCEGMIFRLNADIAVDGCDDIGITVVALSPAVADTVTGLLRVDVALLCDRLESAINGDIPAGAEDGLFARHLLTGIRDGVLLSRLHATGSRLSSATLAVLDDPEAFADRFIGDAVPGRSIHHHARVAARRASLAVFADDLQRRRQWKLQVLDTCAALLPELPDTKTRTTVAGFDEIIPALLNRLFDEFAAESLINEVNALTEIRSAEYADAGSDISDTRLRDIADFATSFPDRDTGRMLLIAALSEDYLRYGLLHELEAAKEALYALFPSTGEFQYE